MLARTTAHPSSCRAALFGGSGQGGIFPSVGLHIAVLIAGSVFLLLNAFHGNIWFDESYSVGIASFSFSEIWSIGSNDVHPVLFYWCLHLLYLLFGDSILAFRLFAVVGMVSLAALGATHVRRDFGWRVGLVFTFLVCFTPYIAIEGTQIRMYSWAAFSVMLCFIYACRIIRALRHRDSDGASRDDSALRRSVVPLRWWAAFFLSSLASAYLHYFAVIAAFLINLCLLLFLLAHARDRLRYLAVFLVGALAQVLLYAPWLVELARQMGVVGGTYWAKFSFPLTLVEWGTYPFFTAPVSFAVSGADGLAVEVAASALCVLLALAFVVVVGRLAVRCIRSIRLSWASGGPRGMLAWAGRDETLFFLMGIAVYVGVLAIGWIASTLMGSLIVYYRYLVVGIGPLLLSFSLALSRVDSKVVVSVAVIAVLALAVLNQALQVRDSYSSENDAPLSYFEESVEKASSSNGGSDPIVLSSDIGIQGVLSVVYPWLPETYLDWQQGNWGAAYQAYAPTLSCVKSWGDVLSGCHGSFVVVGQTERGSVPRDISDIQQQWGAEIVQQETFYRPYERTWFTVAVMRIP